MLRMAKPGDLRRNSGRLSLAGASFVGKAPMAAEGRSAGSVATI
jgi:hypothetical protein